MLLQIFFDVYITNANSQGAGNILEFLTHKYSYPIGGGIYVNLTFILVYDRNQVLISGTKTKVDFGINIRANTFLSKNKKKKLLKKINVMFFHCLG